MAKQPKPFVFLGRGLLNVTVGGVVRMKTCGEIVNGVDELAELGEQHIAELVQAGSATYELARARPLDPSLEKIRLEAEGIAQRNLDFNKSQLEATRKNIKNAVPVPVHDEGKE